MLARSRPAAALTLAGALAWLVTACAATPAGTAPVAVTDATIASDTAADSAIATDATSADVPIEDGSAQDGDSTVGAKTYGVGVLEIDTPGPAGRTLPTTVWYPIASGTTGEPLKYMGIIASPNGAVENAPAAPGPFPLVAFSHGNQGMRQQSAFLVEALAMRGYVVVAPDHVGNTFADYDEKLIPAITALRPLDLRAAIDRMLTPQKSDPAWFTGLSDAKHIAVAGHSFGGYTALAVAGALVKVPPAAMPDCSNAAPTDITCMAMKLAGKPPWNFHDPRVTLALPLAHCGQFQSFGFDLASMKSLTLPVVLQAATGDDVCLLQTQAEPAYAALGGPRALVTLQGGNHFSYSDLCSLPPALSPQIGKYCKNLDPDLATTHAVVLKYALAACDLYLRGDETARPLFASGPDGVVTVESQDIIQ